MSEDDGIDVYAKVTVNPPGMFPRGAAIVTPVGDGTPPMIQIRAAAHENPETGEEALEFDVVTFGIDASPDGLNSIRRALMMVAECVGENPEASYVLTADGPVRVDKLPAPEAVNAEDMPPTADGLLVMLDAARAARQSPEEEGEGH